MTNKTSVARQLALHGADDKSVTFRNDAAEWTLTIPRRMWWTLLNGVPLLTVTVCSSGNRQVTRDDAVH